MEDNTALDQAKMETYASIQRTKFCFIHNQKTRLYNTIHVLAAVVNLLQILTYSLLTTALWGIQNSRVLVPEHHRPLLMKQNKTDKAFPDKIYRE